MQSELDHRINTLTQWIYESQYPVFYTGAGISTESGLSDYRGPDGLWTRRDKGLPPKPMSKPLELIEPNPGHYAIVELEKMGKLKFLISQNIDNLHLKSGIRPEFLAELHGNISKLRCTQCDMTVDKRIANSTCGCGGSLVSSVVNFGQSLPLRDLQFALQHSRKADLFVVVGSSLVVTPAANSPVEALQAGAVLVIITQGQTPLDQYAHLRFFERIGDVLPIVVKRLRKRMGLS